MSEFRVETQKACLLSVKRVVIQNRQQLKEEVERFLAGVPNDCITGPLQCAFQFISSAKGAHEVELRIPLRESFALNDAELREQPEIDLLVLQHTGPVSELGSTYGKVFGEADRRGLISDEYLLESYPRGFDAENGPVDVCFVIHDWQKLFHASAARVLGEEASAELLSGLPPVNHQSLPAERFRYTCELLTRLAGVADEEQQYEIVSRCSHVFPAGQLKKLRAAFLSALSRGGTKEAAVDAVIAFMEEDAGWSEVPVREGCVILSRKRPRDPKAWEAAKTDAERRRAYCFCPLIQDHLEEQTPENFCHCGAGWFRQQWEAVLDIPLRVRTLKTVRAGDEECQFAVDLPEEVV